MSHVKNKTSVTSLNIKKYIFFTLIISLVISALLAILMFIFDKLYIQVILTTLSIGGYSFLGLCCASILTKQKYQYFSLLGIVITIFSLLMVLCTIWWGPIIDFFAQATITLSIVAFSMAHMSLLFLLTESSHKLTQLSLFSTISCIAIVAGMLISLVYIHMFPSNDIYYRILFSIITLDILGTIVTPILSKCMKKT